jgi:hypothetical protein
LQIPKRKHNAVNNHGGNGRRWEIAKAITLVANTNDVAAIVQDVKAKGAYRPATAPETSDTAMVSAGNRET